MVRIFERAYTLERNASKPLHAACSQKVNIALEEHDYCKRVYIGWQVRIFPSFNKLLSKSFFSNTDAKRHEICFLYQLIDCCVKPLLFSYVSLEIVRSSPVSHLWFMKSEICCSKKFKLNIVGEHTIIIYCFFRYSNCTKSEYCWSRFSMWFWVRLAILIDMQHASRSFL